MWACVPGEEDLGCGPRCEQNTLITCDENNEDLRTPCDDQRCASDAPVPQCVPAEALPCDPEAPPEPACENGRRLACGAESAYLLATPCDPGSVCTGASATCLEASAITCSANWNAVCIANERFVCDLRSNTVTTERASCD
jgi:hypothetical protein